MIPYSIRAIVAAMLRFTRLIPIEKAIAQPQFLAITESPLAHFKRKQQF